MDLKSRVIMAKAKIPVYRLVPYFMERYPEYKEKETRVANVLQLRGVDERITEKLEEIAKSFE